jgi:hypothetical protein
MVKTMKYRSIPEQYSIAAAAAESERLFERLCMAARSERGR